MTKQIPLVDKIYILEKFQQKLTRQKLTELQKPLIILLIK